MSTTILPPPTDDRIELDAIMSDARRATPAPLSIAPWDEPRTTSALRSVAPPGRQRWTTRVLSATVAIALGVAVSAALAQLSGEDGAGEALAATHDPVAPPPIADAPPASSTTLYTDVAEPGAEAPSAVETELTPEPGTRREETREERPREPVASREETRSAQAVAATETRVAGPEPATTAEPARTEPPNRAEVQDALERLRADVTACAAGRYGRADVRLTVHPSGRVQGARIEGTFAGTTQGSCIARAVRSARFPTFTGEPFDVAYPYEI